MPDMLVSPQPFAAVVYPSGEAPDGLLLDVADILRRDGVMAAGMLQSTETLPDGCCGPMCLTDIEDGRQVIISQDLGKLAGACRLDSTALTEVAFHLERRIDRGVDLLLVNRFGKAEIEGHGLRSVLERALLTGTPVLLAVRADFASAWAEFHGGLGTTLPADLGSVLGWCRGVLRAEVEPA